jgi:hypothetical protein
MFGRNGCSIARQNYRIQPAWDYHLETAAHTVEEELPLSLDNPKQQSAKQMWSCTY